MAITASNVACGSFSGSASPQGIFPSTFNLFSPWLQNLASPILASRGNTLLGCQHQPSKDISNLTASSRPLVTKQKASGRRATATARRSSNAIAPKSRYYVTDDKPIRSSNHLRREGAKIFTAPTNALRREDSFILVDHGSHFKMVKPGYARLHYQPTPDNVMSIAGYHAFAPVNVSREREVRRLARHLGGVPVQVPVASEDSNVKKGTKRVKFDRPEDDEPQTPRKRARVTPPPGL
ncbi:hypothetical protein CPB83DRAFT_886059 [Crepidotus variabilis]|uniref:Uncharacterized protein n=1 Tax=Crepidotus variabilis TaxID=179855 RepID=A0A9P6E9A1_9AGAR|nr:hypothetical protein CPB83DRAFT_886059 [Crepidotus variabilis]